jgi:hypothetical protein
VAECDGDDEDDEDDGAWGMDEEPAAGGGGGKAVSSSGAAAPPRVRTRPPLPPLPPPPLPAMFTFGDGDAGGDPLRNEGAVRNRPLGTSVESAVSTRPPGVPAEPLRLLHRMLALLKMLTRQLGAACRTSMLRGPSGGIGGSGIGGGGAAAAAASGAAGGVGGDAGCEAWAERLGPLAPGALSPTGASAAGLHARAAARTPAGGESFLLMHARWKKLERDIYHEKKRRFDISKARGVRDCSHSRGARKARVGCKRARLGLGRASQHSTRYPTIHRGEDTPLTLKQR